MIRKSTEENDELNTMSSADFRSLIIESTKQKPTNTNEVLSGACVTENDGLYEEFESVSNCAFDDYTNLEGLRDKLDSIDLVEQMQKDTIRFDEFEALAGFATDMQGTVVHCRGPCIDVNKVYGQDKDGDTLLHIAIIILAVDLAFYFINRSPCFTWLDIQNKMLQTPLHLAVLTNQVSLVRRLVVAGADTESRDKGGNMAIHLACRDNLLNVLRALLGPVSFEEQRANNYSVPVLKKPQSLNSKNFDGFSCLHIANSLGHIDVVKLLIDNNADVNVRAEKSGRTILHEAAWSGKLEMVKYLISLGKYCDINAKTYDGYTAFDLARSRGHWSVVIELATAGAENDELEEQ